PATSSGSPWAFHGTLPHELGRVSTEITSPMEVLSAVTLEAARIMHIDDDVGSVEPGKRADLVLLAGDPLTDPAQLGAIEMVIKSGVVVPTG
ncbi:MAG: amidohydrolase family protein, partial [Deltaproteobacteria bacterium]|nr:amidohydrolase family protein [Deltaproteobacteria bacterium]